MALFIEGNEGPLRGRGLERKEPTFEDGVLKWSEVTNLTLVVVVRVALTAVAENDGNFFVWH